MDKITDYLKYIKAYLEISDRNNLETIFRVCKKNKRKYILESNEESLSNIRSNKKVVIDAIPKFLYPTSEFVEVINNKRESVNTKRGSTSDILVDVIPPDSISVNAEPKIVPLDMAQIYYILKNNNIKKYITINLDLPNPPYYQQYELTLSMKKTGTINKKVVMRLYITKKR